MAMESAKDDEVVVEQVVLPSKKTAEVELVELGSSSDEDEKKPSLNNGQSAYPQHHWSPNTAVNHGISRFHLNGSRIHRLAQRKNKKRPRRNSAEYDNNDLTADGIHLVNAGKPNSDPDVHFSPHFSRILQPHQIGGVKFLYDNIIESIESFDTSDGAGCILAHSMGLGKSIQVISFIEIFFRATRSKKVLIICPINVIQNWAMEFEKWLPETDELDASIRDFQVFLVGDSVRGLDNRAKFIEKWHGNGGVLLIGYEMFRQLVRPMPKSKKSAGEVDETQVFKNAGIRKGLVEALLNPGPDLVVCDEGHKIKNIKTEVAAALNAIRTRRRIVLTGYPLQNNLMEYYCMVDFVRPSLLGTKKEFCTMFEKPINKGLCIDSTPKDIKLARQRTHVLRGIIHSFIQRRTQHLLKKILPLSREYIVLVRKTPIQRELYRGFIAYAAEEMKSQNSNWFNPLKAYSICSKVLNHPDLLYNALLKKRKLYLEAIKNQKERRVENNLRIQEQASMAQEVNTSANYSHTEQQNNVPYFQNSPQFTTYPSTLNGCMGRDVYPADWSLNSQSMYYGNSSNSNSSSQLSNPNTWNNYPNTSNSNGLTVGLNASTVESSTNDYFPKLSSSNGLLNPQFNNLSSISWDCWNAQNQFINCMQNSYPHFQAEEPNFPLTQIGHDGCFASASSSAAACGCGEQNIQSTVCNTKNNGGNTVNNSQKAQKRLRRGVVEEEIEDEEELPEDNSIKFDWAEEILRNYISGALENSAKMVIAMDIINETMRRGEKILFFSGSVLTLDLFETYLKREGKEGQEQWRRNANYCRFDGSTNASDRERFINRFNHDPDLSLFLISTRAGSLGVNLVSANRCIIFDASWNPCHDAQAICSQKKRTFIYRLIVNNSMEKGIFNRQVSKNGLQQRVVDAENIDANVTSKELESLLFYDESQDVISGKWDVDQWELEDELLIKVAKQHSTLLAECPFLHESLLLEREEKLSEEEKREAEALFEREKNGGFINESSFIHSGGYGSSGPRHFPPGFHSPYTGLNSALTQSLSTSTPFPKTIELVSNLSENNGQSLESGARDNFINPFRPNQPLSGGAQHKGGAEEMLIINKEVQLPSVKYMGKYFVVKPGEAVYVLRSLSGIYFRTQDGNLLDARSLVHPPPKFDPNEVIELD